MLLRVSQALVRSCPDSISLTGKMKSCHTIQVLPGVSVASAAGAVMAGASAPTPALEQARGSLALSAIYDGASWSEAGRVGEVRIQIACNLVRRFNAEPF